MSESTYHSLPKSSPGWISSFEYDGADAILIAWKDGLKPDPHLLVSEWADEHRILSTKSSDEGGAKWRTKRTPFLKEIMDELSPSSPTDKIAFMKGAQVGGTECGNNWVGYVIDQCPAPMMCVAPSLEMAKRNSRQRIETLINDSPRLRKKIAPARSRDSGNTILSKEFPGGMLILTGFNSPSSLRSSSIRFLFNDEIDAIEHDDLGGEGSPLAIVERRTATFRRRRKIFYVSTPTEASTSKIKIEFENGDQRYYNVPCPHCGHKQRLVFANLKWEEGKPETVRYICEHCEGEIYERHKTQMLLAGEWIPTAKPKYKKYRSYHLSSLYSPVGWYSFEDAVIDYEKALKDKNQMKTFINTVLGECYEDEFEAPEWERLYERRCNYPMGIVPKEGLFLTCGVDFQKDRAECEIISWSRNRISHSVDYIVIPYKTNDSRLWKELNKILAKEWPHALGGTLPIRVMCVDSGYSAQEVYSWVKTHPQAVWGAGGARASQPRTVVAVKGRANETALICNVSKADTGGKRQGLKVWSIGTPVAKTELYSWLKLPRLTDEQIKSGEQIPPGSCFFPEYGEEYFKQLTAEKKVTRFVKGFPKSEWEKDPNRNNEALDCRVYGRVAASIVGLDRMKELQWRRFEKALGKTQTKTKPKLKTNNKKSMPFAKRTVTASDDPYL